MTYLLSCAAPAEERRWAWLSALLVGLLMASTLLAGADDASRPKQEVLIARNLPYARMAGAPQRLTSLDVYAPKTGQAHPVLVFIHGGAWRVGDKGRAGEKGRAFAREGFVFASVNYRLSPAVKHPAHVQDVAKAIAWVRAHAAEYRGDPKRIYVMGHSAGAHLAALVATDGSYLKQEEQALSALKGVILLDGAGYDIPLTLSFDRRRAREMYEAAFGSDPETWKAASPITHVAKGKDIPPFLIFHVGRRVGSRIQAQRLATALEDAGVSARVVHASDKTHATLNRELGQTGDVPTRQVLEFLRRCERTRPDQRPVRCAPNALVPGCRVVQEHTQSNTEIAYTGSLMSPGR